MSGRSRVRVTKCYTAVCPEHGWYGHDWSSPNAARERASARAELEEHRREQHLAAASIPVTTKGDQ